MTRGPLTVLVIETSSGFEAFKQGAAGMCIAGHGASPAEAIGDWALRFFHPDSKEWSPSDVPFTVVCEPMGLLERFRIDPKQPFTLRPADMRN